jgi:AMMECR1 domain-containing protein
MAAFSEVEALRNVRPYVDGLLLESGRHRGIFLPQVWGSAPDARDFLGLLKQKAGLPPDFWSDEICLYRFQVTKCSEPEIGCTVQ